MRCSPGEQDAETDIPVTLIGLDTVAGHVMNAGGTQAVGNADIILSASGNFTDPLSAVQTHTEHTLPGQHSSGGSSCHDIIYHNRCGIVLIIVKQPLCR